MRYQALAFITLFAVLLCDATNVHAATLAEDGFEDYTAGDQVHGLNGGQGFTAAWNVGNAARRPEFTVVNGGLSYSNGSINILGGNLAAQYSATEGGIDVLAGRSFPAQSGAVYLSFLYSQSVENGSADFMQIGFDTGTTSNPRVSAMDRNDEFQLRSTTSAANSVGTGIASDVMETYLIVLKADKTGGSSTYNDLSMWVDPISDVEGDNSPLAISSVNSGLNLSASAAFAIRKAFQESGDTFLIDEIRIGETFADVTASAVVPEPASVAIWLLIGVGLAAFGYRARRKK